jgi:Fe-Mn family superoxide dismutase
MQKENKTIIVGLHNREFSALKEPKIIEKGVETLESKTQQSKLKEKYELPHLPYTYDALEPFIDRATMEVHYTRHHVAYVNNLNKALEGMENVPYNIEDLLKNIKKANYSMVVRNNAGGHYNHSVFWKLMKARGGGVPSGKLSEAIITTYGSFEDFKTKFTEVASKIFGSGWAWLVVNNGKLEIGSTSNQDSPIMDSSDFKGHPVLCLDVWEHAYYLKHQNKRADYINAWWNVVNWNQANANFEKVK